MLRHIATLKNEGPVPKYPNTDDQTEVIHVAKSEYHSRRR